MKKIIWVLVIIFGLYFWNSHKPTANLAKESAPKEEENYELSYDCRMAISSEIYMSKAMVYKENGSYDAYKKALSKAKEYGSEIGYSDADIEYRVRNKIPKAGLADLDETGVVIEPFMKACRADPDGYILNYKATKTKKG
ncbi:TPA: hypothetical protein OUE28_003545 [Morganella morganii]|nr:hypothetical protein [Morganella morganii]